MRGSECPGWMCARVHQPYGLQSPLCSSQPPKNPSWAGSPLLSPLSSALPGWGRGTRSGGPPSVARRAPLCTLFFGVPFLWPCRRNLPEWPVSSWRSSKSERAVGSFVSQPWERGEPGFGVCGAPEVAEPEVHEGHPRRGGGRDPSFCQEMVSWRRGARGGVRQHRHSGAGCMVYLSQNEQRGGKMLGKSPNRRISNSSTVRAETRGPSSLTQSSSG